MVKIDKGITEIEGPVQQVVAEVLAGVESVRSKVDKDTRKAMDTTLLWILSGGLEND